MQIVIDVPEDIYHYVMNTGTYGHYRFNSTGAIRNGKPLPKGHGRLIDEESVSLSGIHFETERDHAMMIGRLNSAPTIIEADR